MPNLEISLDATGGARYITVCDIQSAYHEIPVAESGIEKTAFVTQKGKHVFKRLPSGIACAPWLFQRITALTFPHFGPGSGLLAYMNDLLCCTPTWETHIHLLEETFKALQTAGLTLKPSKTQFDPGRNPHRGRQNQSNTRSPNTKNDKRPAFSTGNDKFCPEIHSKRSRSFITPGRTHPERSSEAGSRTL